MFVFDRWRPVPSAASLSTMLVIVFLVMLIRMVHARCRVLKHDWCLLDDQVWFVHDNRRAVHDDRVPIDDHIWSMDDYIRSVDHLRLLVENFIWSVNHFRVEFLISTFVFHCVLTLSF